MKPEGILRTSRTAGERGRFVARLGLVLALAALVVWASGGSSRHAFGASTFTVNSTGDADDLNVQTSTPLDGICDVGGSVCTLRAAIEEANANAGTDTINFSIGGGGSIATISPGIPLPTISDPVVIDGTTQCCFVGIEIDGSLCGTCTDGLDVTAGSTTLKGLNVNSFTAGAGIALMGPNGGNTLRQVFSGTDKFAGAADGNGTGLLIAGSSNNTTVDGGVLSGNSGVGLQILESGGVGASNNIIKGLNIGSNGGGTYAIPNGGAGVEIDGTGTQAVTGNHIGNGSGGNAPAGNSGPGVYIHGAMASGNFVQNDSVGFVWHSPTTWTAIPNGSGLYPGVGFRSGVYISGGAHDNQVGGNPSLGLADTIAYNAGAGIAVDGGGTGNHLGPGVLTHDNGGLGIDIAPLGSVTATYDAALTSALYCGSCATGGQVIVTGYTRGGPPNTALGIDVLRNTGCDSSGHGEGALPVLATTSHVPPNGFMTDTNGDLSGAGSFTGLGNIVGQNIVTTITTPDGTTSEYSNCVQVQNDTDGDGIQNSIDVLPSTFSDNSSDIPLGGGGTSFAQIIDRAGCYVSIVDLPNPDGGVIGNICPPSGGGPATVLVCGIATLTLNDGESIGGTCGSVHTNVGIGPVTEKFGAFNATLPTKTLSTIVQLGAHSYSVNNDASSVASITVDCTSIAPGNTVTFNDTDADGLGDDVESNSGTDAGACDRGTNPNVADTDADGLLDGTEVNGVTTENFGLVETNPNVHDTDGDGCGDGSEVGASATTGGRRNPTNPYDYFNPSHDHQNRVDDILIVVHQFFKDSGNPAYNPDTDRTFLGPNLWNLGPPNGLQRVDDILASVHQFFHDCS